MSTCGQQPAHIYIYIYMKGYRDDGVGIGKFEQRDDSRMSRRQMPLNLRGYPQARVSNGTNKVSYYDTNCLSGGTSSDDIDSASKSYSSNRRYSRSPSSSRTRWRTRSRSSRRTTPHNCVTASIDVKFKIIFLFLCVDIILESSIHFFLFTHFVDIFILMYKSERQARCNFCK